MAKATNYVGKQVTIKAGTYVVRSGKLVSIRKAPSTVTVIRQETAKGGKTRVYWKSHGVYVSALV